MARASGLTGVNKLTRLPSGSWNIRERLPHGIVVGSLTKSTGQMPDPVVVGVDVVDQEFDDRGVIVRGAGRAGVLV